MITRPTLFIIGAGAMCPYGLPSGAQLLRDLEKGATLTPPPGSIASEDPRFLTQDSDRFAKSLRAAQPSSIDDFLRERSDLRDFGKRAIAHRLIQCESEQSLHAHEVDDHWLNEMWALIRAEPAGLRENKVSFIIYNYDRSFEHYMTTAVASYFNIAPSAAWEHLSKLRIVHPHGQLGNYVPQGYVEKCEGRRYGNTDNWQEELLAAQAMRFYWEEGHADVKEKMWRAIEDAERIIFLGFGFHPTNLDALLPMLKRRHDAYKDIDLFGTNVGLSSNVQLRVEATVPRNPHFKWGWNDKGCSDLLKNTVPFYRDNLPRT